MGSSRLAFSASGAVVSTGLGPGHASERQDLRHTGVPGVFCLPGQESGTLARVVGWRRVRLGGRVGVNEGELMHYAVFFGIVAVALATDLFFVGRKDEVLKTRTAFAWGAVWVSLGLGFSSLVYLWYG